MAAWLSVSSCAARRGMCKRNMSLPVAPGGRHGAWWARARAGRGQSCGGGDRSRFAGAVPVPGWEGAHLRG
jgi:hypothetical protein